MFDGSDTQKISWQIDDYWKGIPEAGLDDIQAEKINGHIYVYVGNITAPTIMSNVMFDYDIAQNDWNRLQLSDSSTHLHTFVTTTGKKLFMGTDDGKIFQLFTGSAQNTASYSSFVETNWIYGVDFHDDLDYYELITYGENLNSVFASYKIDEDKNPWIPIGQLENSFTWLSFKKRGYRVKFLLSEMTKNNMWELYMLEFGFMGVGIKK
jgi:hypothetical protein